MANDNLRILIAGGGTGGHVIPALAVAGELRDRHSAEVRFIGTARGIETRLVPAAGFPLDLIEVGQLNRVGLRTQMKTAARLPLAVLECLRLLRRFRPHAVLGVGGYASGPAMLAAVLARTPRVAFEPNAIPGLTNRVLGRWVQAAAVNFPETRRYFRNAKVTGIPVRAEFFHLPPRPADLAPQLLVFGGSQGARALNEAMPRIAANLFQAIPGLTIVHQCGPRHLQETEEAYRQAVGPAKPAELTNSAETTETGSLAAPAEANSAGAGISGSSAVAVYPFLDDMPARFAAASLILCRSGASTVAELTAAGKPSLLVPFPRAADDHQRHNAEALVNAGAAAMLLEPDITPERLLDILTNLLTDSSVLANMAQQARSLARPDAAADIAELLESQRRVPILQE
jgi:UDP-N-acetylglucosamine--N-acetylmuramyl-(pentapeptide) pyrophosphoryl-undecaprenol N-acetylglucosamine transferase